MSRSAQLQLRPGYEISRVIRGGWQLAGGHGRIDRQAAIADLAASFSAGIATFDCADIYTGVEELIGEFRRGYRDSHGAEALSGLKVHTKFVPDLDILPVISKAHVRAVIDRSLRRLGMERLDLVQFHWWDYALPGCVETALWLKELQQEGKINLLGGTNFDTPHTSELLAADVPLVSMQVQYSLLDARPEHGLVGLCRERDIHLLCYGSVAGGFLSDRWLGCAEPAPPFENRSLTKYKLIIDDFGGWALFQKLLRRLRNVADRHGVDIATVASRAVLDRPQVAAVIVGARCGSHLPANLAIMGLRLTAADHAEIDAVLAERRGPEGDTFTLERDRAGRHGSIMKYNLSKQASMTRLAAAAAHEVEALHAAFVELFTGRSSDLGRCAAALAADFEMVTAEGACLGRDAVLAGLRTARAAADFRIAISAVRPLWARGDWVLLQYVEQQYREGRTTRRRSTALFEARAEAPGGVVWRYLHETWMPNAGS